MKPVKPIFDIKVMEDIVKKEVVEYEKMQNSVDNALGYVVKHLGEVPKVAKELDKGWVKKMKVVLAINNPVYITTHKNGSFKVYTPNFKKGERDNGCVGNQYPWKR